LQLSNGRNNAKCRRYYYYLTLIGEEAKAVGWDNLTYENLLNVLKENEIEITSRFNEATKIIYFEYITSLTHMVKAVNEFQDSFEYYPMVFNRRKEKKCKQPNEMIVVSQKMETIFQKAFYRIVADKMSNTNYLIDETHGMALLEFEIHKITHYYNDIDYKIGIQFQADNIKLFFRPLKLSDYKSSKIENIKYSTKTAFRSIADDIKKNGIKNDKKGLLSFSRLNLNLSNNTKRKRKAFISISFKRNRYIPELKNYANVVSCFQNEYNILEIYANVLNKKITMGQ